MNTEFLHARYKEIMLNVPKDVWHAEYKQMVAQVEQVRHSLQQGGHLDAIADESFLHQFIFKADNGIASKGQSGLKKEVYAKLIHEPDFITALEQLILTPDHANFLSFKQVTDDLCVKHGNNRIHLICNRIAAACNLDLCTIVDKGSLDRLMGYLNRGNIIHTPDEIVYQDWFVPNSYLVQQFVQCFKQQLDTGEIDRYSLNIFMWKLYDHLHLKAQQTNDNDTKPNKNHGQHVNKKNLNRILYGAAGTGKTYHTINHALSIINPEEFEQLRAKGRKDLKHRFDQYLQSGQIQFVTFHQSFSYEDFVEGIRAKSNANGTLSYDVEDGIFKIIAEDARKDQEAIEFEEEVVSDESIASAIQVLVERAKSSDIKFTTKNGVEFEVKASVRGSLRTITKAGKRTGIGLSLPAIARYLKNQSDEIIARKSYEWAVARALRDEVNTIKHGLLDETKRYVLIIDEINRGNISRIFGELITLIENTKRTGAEEVLSVILPYSKQAFSVPDNLYIIGTMNSSDRSLTGLDIALRRRFSFIEMPPRPELIQNSEGQPLMIEGIDIAKLLTVMNQRIEILLDRDHCIGHANFMQLSEASTLDDLADIFQQQVIPQLQEYFFDDWEHINLVLNDNRMLRQKYQNQQLSSLFKKAIPVRSIWEIDAAAFKLKQSYLNIYSAADLLEVQGNEQAEFMQQ